MSLRKSMIRFELNNYSERNCPSLVLARQSEETFSHYGLDNTLINDEDLPKCAIHLHAHYSAEAFSILSLLGSCFPCAHLYLTYTDNQVFFELQDSLEALSSRNPQVTYSALLVPNHGRNVEPLFRYIFPLIRDFPLVLHLHTKRSCHHSIGGDWMSDLCSCLLSHQYHVRSIRSAFASNPRLGIVMPRPFEYIRPYIGWGSNFRFAKRLFSNIYPAHSISRRNPLIFPAGMMFWFRPDSMLGMLKLYSLCVPVPDEPLAVDGTCLHALERLLVFSCEAEDYTWAFAFPSETQFSFKVGDIRRLSVFQHFTMYYFFLRIRRFIQRLA
jgi:lipopolysaccharide biosynthesis protein